MSTQRIVTLRIAIAALIWASALLAPAAAAPINPAAAHNAVAPIERLARESFSAMVAGAPPAGQASYRSDAPDASPATPGPTDPNGPYT